MVDLSEVTHASSVINIVELCQEQQDRAEKKAKKIARGAQAYLASQRADRLAERADRNARMWHQCRDDIRAIEEVLTQLQQQNANFAHIASAFGEPGFIKLLVVGLVKKASTKYESTAHTSKAFRRINLDFCLDAKGAIRLQAHDSHYGRFNFDSQVWPDALQEEFMDQVNWLATDFVYLGQVLFRLSTKDPFQPEYHEIIDRKGF